jgi:activator of HSP90 ATPase
MILPLGASATDIYRSVDENGIVVYSDRPTDRTELVQINTSVPDSPTTAASRANGEESDDSASNTPLVAEIPREATPEEIASDRARNCELARQMVTAYSQAHQLFREGADGEREYLTAAEIDEARSKADSNVATWCD